MDGVSNFSFGSVLSGISKTLGVAREVIPLWQQTKPLFNNVRTAYTLIKEVNSVKSTPSNNTKKVIQNKTNNINNEKTIIKSNNSPQFFI